jgi:hypothetical protein
MSQKLTKEQRLKRDEFNRKLRNSFIVITLLPVIADHLEDMLEELPVEDIPQGTLELLEKFRTLDEKFIGKEWSVMDDQVKIQREFRYWIGRNFV